MTAMKPTMKPTRYKVIVSSLFQACRTEMFWYLLTMLLLALLGPLSLLCRGRLLDAAVSGEGKLFGEMLLFGGIFLLSLLMTYGNRLGRQRMRKKLYGHFSEQVLGKFSRIRYAAYESQEALDTIKRAGDAPQEHILEFFTTFLEAASELIRIFCYGAVFAGLSFWCLILGIPAFGAMLYFDLKRIRLMMGLYEGQTREERLMESYEGALSGKETLYDLRVAGAVPFFLKKRKGLSDRIVKERYRRTIQSQLVYSYGEMATVLWMAVVLFFSVNALLKGKATLGLFVALVGSLQQMAGTFRALGEKYSELQRRAAYVGYYVAFLELAEAPAGKTALTEKEEPLAGKTALTDQEESPAGKTALTEKEALAGKKGTREAAGKGIRFEHVTFTYPGRKEPALRDVSFAMAPGTRTALVGHNGSGKSTLVKLLCGLYQPDSGHIFIDGQDVAQMSPDALRRHFSVVFQDYGKYSFHKLLNAYAVNLAERRNLGRYGIIGIFTELNQDTALFHCLDGFLPAVIAGSKRKIDYRGIYAVEYRAYSVTQFLSQQPRISGRIYAVACSVAAYGHISAMHLYGIYLVLTRYIGNIYFIVIGILYCIPTELY